MAGGTEMDGVRVCIHVGVGQSGCDWGQSWSCGSASGAATLRSGGVGSFNGRGDGGSGGRDGV